MNETQFQEKVTDLCDWLRLRWYHVNDSRRDKAGFPDLVIVGPHGVVFAELKSSSGKVSAAQKEWHDDLRLAGSEAYIWRPDDWPFIQNTLQRLARR
jgi:hypothetical protein